VYEFFLADIETHDFPSGHKLKTVWRAVDSGEDIVEYSLMSETGIPGPRLLEILQRLKLLPNSLTDQVNAQALLRRNTRLYAEVQRHWPSSKTEEIEFEFSYRTITPELSTESRITESDKKKVQFRARQVNTLKELRSKLESSEPNLIPALDQMIKSGEVTLT
jgi:hypothetical protein